MMTSMERRLNYLKPEMKTATKKPEQTAPRITCAPPGQALWDVFKDYVEPEHIKKQWNFQLMVIVDSFLGPLSPRYEYILDMGVPHLKAVYAQQPLPAGDMTFIFPDRWITPRFAIMFNHVLNKNPSIVAEAKAGKRRKILIVCFQPYIVGDCMKEQVRIIREDEEMKDWKPDLQSLWGIPKERW
jgi:hypothetical protein